MQCILEQTKMNHLSVTRLPSKLCGVMSCLLIMTFKSKTLLYYNSCITSELPHAILPDGFQTVTSYSCGWPMINHYFVEVLIPTSCP